MTYASKTKVSVEKSQIHIKQVLQKYGVDGFGIMERGEVAAVMFETGGISIQIDVQIPMRDKFNSNVSHDQDIRQKWRALLLVIKAKLEAVECGISTLEKEFMPFMVMQDGRQMHQHVLPMIDEMMRLGKMPTVLMLEQK